jgi:hypothetical protein
VISKGLPHRAPPTERRLHSRPRALAGRQCADEQTIHRPLDHVCWSSPPPEGYGSHTHNACHPPMSATRSPGRRLKNLSACAGGIRVPFTLAPFAGVQSNGRHLLYRVFRGRHDRPECVPYIWRPVARRLWAATPAFTRASRHDPERPRPLSYRNTVLSSTPSLVASRGRAGSPVHLRVLERSRASDSSLLLQVRPLRGLSAGVHHAAQSRPDSAREDIGRRWRWAGSAT